MNSGSPDPQGQRSVTRIGPKTRTSLYIYGAVCFALAVIGPILYLQIAPDVPAGGGRRAELIAQGNANLAFGLFMGCLAFAIIGAALPWSVYHSEKKKGQ